MKTGSGDKKEAFLLCRARSRTGKDDKSYGPYNWYTIDVNNYEIKPAASIPEMPSSDVVASSIGVSNSYIFVIGGLCWRCQCPSCKGIRNYHEQSTVRYLDVSKPREQWAWKVAPDMSVGRSTPQFVDAGDSKIYVFGGVRHPNSAPLGEVFDTCQLEDDDRSGMCWDPLPALPCDILRSCQLESGITITRPVVVDSKRQRILVHFKGLNSLCAYYPSQNSWTCIDSNFDSPSWLYSVLVDDHDVLYSLRPSMAREEIDWGVLNTFDLHAYNLVDNTWLNVTWSNPDKFPLYVIPFKSSFFHMGNGKLCIVSPRLMISPRVMINHTQVLLTTIQVCRTPLGHIVAESEPFKALRLDGFLADFIPLPQGINGKAVWSEIIGDVMAAEAVGSTHPDEKVLNSEAVDGSGSSKSSTSLLKPCTYTTDAVTKETKPMKMRKKPLKNKITAQVMLKELSHIHGLEQTQLLKAVDLMKHDKVKFETFCELPQELKQPYLLMHLGTSI